MPQGTVIEAHNIHEEPTRAFRIEKFELIAKVSDWCSATRAPVDGAPGIIVWHTHPSGLVGPSSGDLEVRQEYRELGYDIPMLVVALPSGEAVRF